MDDLFDEYNARLRLILNDVEEQLKLCKSTSLSASTAHKSHLNQLERYLSLAEETLSQMELDARGSDVALATDRINEINRIRGILKEVSDSANTMYSELQQKELLEGGYETKDIGRNPQCHVFRENTKLLKKGSAYIQSSCAIADETEMIGNRTAAELYGQRNIISSVKGRIEDTKLSLSSADEYLSKLLKQGRLNRVVLSTVFGAAIFSVVLIVFCRILRLVLFAKWG